MLHIENTEDYVEKISSGKVVVKYGAVWCFPCRQIEPLFDQLAQEYPDIKFLSVDVEKIDHKDTYVATVPTFKFFNQGVEQESLSFTGANNKKLEATVASF